MANKKIAWNQSASCCSTALLAWTKAKNVANKKLKAPFTNKIDVKKV